MDAFTKDQLVQVVIKVLPYAEQMRDLDLFREMEAIRFTWRGDRFRVSLSGFTETVDNGMLVGGNRAILMQALVQRGLVQLLMDEAAKKVA
jgi:hypothetical protein